MSQLIITRGLPACGKTTRAIEWLAEGVTLGLKRARVNRDIHREHTFGRMPMLDSGGETMLSVIAHQEARTFLSYGWDVIADDMNLSLATVEWWRRDAISEDADFKIWDMRHVPLSTCIAQDKARAEAGGWSAGEAMILRLAGKHSLYPNDVAMLGGRRG